MSKATNKATAADKAENDGPTIPTINGGDTTTEKSADNSGTEGPGSDNSATEETGTTPSDVSTPSDNGSTSTEETATEGNGEAPEESSEENDNQDAGEFINERFDDIVGVLNAIRNHDESKPAQVEICTDAIRKVESIRESVVNASRKFD